MGYKYFGYFLAVIVLLLTAVGGWIAVMVSKEKSLLGKLDSSFHDSREEGTERPWPEKSSTSSEPEP
ncbi:MAG: hypothetical protein ACE5LH_01245 [Fidelibacterota bacterium]